MKKEKKKGKNIIKERYWSFKSPFKFSVSSGDGISVSECHSEALLIPHHTGSKGWQSHHDTNTKMLRSQARIILIIHFWLKKSLRININSGQDKSQLWFIGSVCGWKVVLLCVIYFLSSMQDRKTCCTWPRSSKQQHSTRSPAKPVTHEPCLAHISSAMLETPEQCASQHFSSCVDTSVEGLLHHVYHPSHRQAPSVKTKAGSA